MTATTDPDTTKNDTDSVLRAHSTMARLHEPGAGVSPAELRLAARNHGMPLELMRDDITPAGLHYLLIHFDIPPADPHTWTMRIDGAVGQEVGLDLDQLRSRPSRTARVTLECAGNGRARLDPRPESQPWIGEAIGTADWTGTPLAPLLREAGLLEDAVDVVFTGADHGVERGIEQDYQRSLPVDEALSDDVLVAYEMNGSPLPPQHGFPLRLVVPGWYGMAHVKWLNRITVLTEEFTGYQNAIAYRFKTDADDVGIAVTRMEPRAMVIPPGFPDFMSRTRFVPAGRVNLVGRAWSGWAPIERVKVSTDGGTTWAEADLDPDKTDSTETHATETGAWTWRRFHFTWHAEPGEHEICAWAYDESGRKQPLETAWNRGGFANNEVQRIPVVVLPA